MKKLLFIIGLIVAAYLAYYCVSGHSVKIQNDITSRLTQSFGAQGISDNINMAVSGRDVTLTGTVLDEQLKVEAGQLASKLYGVRAVNNQIQVTEPPSMAMAEPEVFESEPVEDIAVDDASLFDLGFPPVGEAVEASEVVSPEVVEEPKVIEEPEVELAVPAAVADEPLVVTNRKIIRRDVDSVIALKTVEAKCEGNLTSLLEGQKINFDSGRATIQPRSYDLLDRIVVAAKNCHEETIITINGYTDNTGNLEANRQLSLDRARAVGRYMLKRGVAKQVKVVGNGANDPVADNDTEEGRAQNRRIEFKVYKSAN